MSEVIVTIGEEVTPPVVIITPGETVLPTASVQVQTQEETPVVHIHVDENSAQSAADSAAAAQAVLDALATLDVSQKLDKGGYVGTAKNLDDAIKALQLPDGFIKTTPITFADNIASIAPHDFKWILNLNLFENLTLFQATINPATEGYWRSDIIIADATGSFNKYQGDEDADAAIQLPTPEGTLLVTAITVFGGEIVSWTNINMDGYVSKKEKSVVQIFGGGSNLSLSDESAFFEIYGFTGAIEYIYNQFYRYVGKIYTIKNKSNSNKTLIHNAVSSENNKLFFTFPNGIDFILKPNEQIDFRETGSGRLDFIGVIITKSDIGLSEVNNTSDGNKPVSIAQATADATTLASAQSYAANLIAQIINGAPSDADTLKELNDKIIALQAIVGGTAPDGDSIVNTVTELLAVFATFPEGVNLVTLLAGKVNTTDVYNALDCIVANKVLDARQGKVLNDLITTLTTTVSGKQNTLTDVNFGAFENSLTSKLVPLDADSVSIIDTADSNKAKKTTFTQIKAFLKTYFDTLYGIIFGIVDVAGTTYQFLLTDNGKKIVTSSATAVTVTIPTNAVVALPIGARIKLTQQGSGVVTLVVTGITIVSSSPLYTIKGQTITLEKTALNTWTIEGNNLNGEIMLPAFPNTRNDGQIPTNRILSTDASGNLKMYTIATAPAPYLNELIPDSSLPSSTGDFILKGAFFTPTMTVVITGQTVNYITFYSDNLVKVNVTTGAAEGIFAITLNNGLSATFPTALLLSLGTVHNLTTSDYTTISANIDASAPGTLKQIGSIGSGVANGLLIPANKNFRITYSKVRSPLGYNSTDRNMGVVINKASDNSFLWGTQYWYSGHNTVCTKDTSFQNDAQFIPGGSYYITTSLNSAGSSPTEVVTLERIAGIFRFKKQDGSVFGLSSVQYNGDVKVNFNVLNADYANIKYIELA